MHDKPPSLERPARMLAAIAVVALATACEDRPERRPGAPETRLAAPGMPAGTGSPAPVVMRQHLDTDDNAGLVDERQLEPLDPALPDQNGTPAIDSDEYALFGGAAPEPEPTSPPPAARDPSREVAIDLDDASRQRAPEPRPETSAPTPWTGRDR